MCVCVCVCVCVCAMQVSAEGRASLNELLYLETGGKSSIVELQVCAPLTRTRIHTHSMRCVLVSVRTLPALIMHGSRQGAHTYKHAHECVNACPVLLVCVCVCVHRSVTVYAAQRCWDVRSSTSWRRRTAAPSCGHWDLTMSRWRYAGSPLWDPGG